jgi:hypothetical protein
VVGAVLEEPHEAINTLNTTISIADWMTSGDFSLAQLTEAK